MPTHGGHLPQCYGACYGGSTLVRILRESDSESIAMTERHMTCSRWAVALVMLPLFGFCDVSDQAASADSPSSQNGIDAANSVVQIAAHRGGYRTDKADDAPENAVANIRNCQSKGYQVYETDVQRTKDGHFVVVHDATLDRETTGSGPTNQIDLIELKTLRKRFRDGSVSKHRVATLREFLVEGRNRVVFKADLKPGVNQYFKEIMAVVIDCDAMAGITFRVPYRDVDLFESYRSNGVPYDRRLLMFMVSNKKQVDDINRRFAPAFVQVNLAKDDPTKPETLELIRYATEKGIRVETHAEGTEDDWRKLVLAGVRMFHTSKPARMDAFLRTSDAH